MLPHQSSLHTNLLLARLVRTDLDYLASAIRIERASQGRILVNRFTTGSDVWFPISCVTALSVTDDEGRTVQTGVVGGEGCVGLEALFPGAPVLIEAVVQVAGDLAVIPAAHLRQAAEIRGTIMPVLARFLCEMSAQSSLTVACNRLHSLESRCCRWLLMLQDRVGKADLPLTQECLATMLGSGRPRINGLLASLEHAGLVRRSRGRLRLLTRPGLKAHACDCYRLVQYPPYVGN